MVANTGLEPVSLGYEPSVMAATLTRMSTVVEGAEGPETPVYSPSEKGYRPYFPS